MGTQTKKRENLTNFFKQNIDILNDPLDIANGFNDFFASAKVIQNLPKAALLSFQIFFSFRSKNIACIKKLKPKKSAGVY